jgi:hypothetical protein
MPRLARFVRQLALGFAVAFCGSPPALGATHPGPSIWGEIVIEPTKVLFKIEGAADPFRTNFRLPHLPIGPLEEDQVAANRAAIEKFMRDDVVVKLDDVEVEPLLVEIYVQDGKPEEMSWRSTRVNLEYPCATEPQRVTLIWPHFEGEGITYFPVVIRRGAKGSPRQFQVFPEEPEYTWHADSVRPRIAGAMKQYVAPRRSYDVPVPSLVALTLAALVLLLARRLPRRVAPIAFAVLVAVAVFAKNSGHVTVRSPFERIAPLPSESQARELFATLNGNVYRAFDAESESAIYDLLADSVDGALLDQLYGEIYESLLLREQGGAICSVDAVEDVDGKIDLVTRADAEPPQFGVEWHWRVMGAVSHYGHVHRRMNEYRADFVVRHDGETWKIAQVTVKDHQRVDEFE